jgi:hypothetical protein
MHQGLYLSPFTFHFFLESVLPIPLSLFLPYNEK